MKVICFVVVLFLVVLIDFNLAYLHDLEEGIHSNCIEEYEIGESDFNAQIRRHHKNSHHVRHNFKCYFKCLLEQMDLFDDLGRVDLEKSVNHRHIGEVRRAAITFCRELNEDIEESCEYAFRFYFCFNELLEQEEDQF